MQQEQDSSGLISIPLPDSIRSEPAVSVQAVSDSSDAPEPTVDSVVPAQVKTIKVIPKTQASSNKEVLLVAAPERTFNTQEQVNETVADSSQSTVVFSPEYSLKVKTTASWEVFILVAAIFLIAFVKAFNRRRFDLLLSAFVNNNSVATTLREERVFFNQAVWLLLLSFLLSMSLYIMHLTDSLKPEIISSNLSFFLKTFLFLFLVYIIKFSVLELISELIDSHKAIHEYIFNVILFNIVAGTVILPLLLYKSVVFGNHEWAMIVSAIFIGLIYIYRNWRLIQISFKYRFSIYYIFLYLCTLEILPAIILIKLLQTQ